MKVKEIHMGLSGVIPIASYENLRPSFDVTLETVEGEDPEVLEVLFAKIRKILHSQFEVEENRAKTDLIEKQYQNIRFRVKDGKKYPSVTSITKWDKDWKISDDELQQYGARGTVWHKLIEEFIKSKGIWPEPDMLPDLKGDLITLATGSLKLDWRSCSAKKFFAQFGKDFEFLKTEQTVFNDENLYSGRYDALAKYKGKLSIVDFKTGTSYHHKQLAAYAVCEKGIEQTVICPVGFTKNKSGVMKPDVTDDIQGNFKQFLRDRTKFRQRFGI